MTGRGAMEMRGHFEAGGILATGSQPVERNDDRVAVAAVLGEFVLFVRQAALPEGADFLARLGVFRELVRLGRGRIAGARNVVWFRW